MNSVKQMFSELPFLEPLTKNNEEIHQRTDRAYGHSQNERVTVALFLFSKGIFV